MSEFRRRLMMQIVKGDVPDIPAGWHEIEYIVFTNANAIDSGIVPTENIRLEFKGFGKTNDYAHNAVFGTWNELYLKIGSGYWGLGYNANESSSTSVAGLEYRNWYTVIFKKKGIHNHLAVFQDHLTTEAKFEGDLPDNTSKFKPTIKTMYIGNANDAPAYTKNACGVCYVKIWSDDDILLRDFIPVSNGTEEALYDKVTQQLFHKLTV